MKIEEVKKLLEEDMNNVTSLNELNELKNKYLSKTGLITVLNTYS